MKKIKKNEVEEIFTKLTQWRGLKKLVLCSKIIMSFGMVSFIVDFVGRVVEILLDKYVVSFDGRRVLAIARGNVKKSGNILVGDVVRICEIDGKYVIKTIEKRKNKVIRPPVSNIDQMIIVVSLKNPVPDYLLLDMQLVFCISNDIEPVIVVNKVDLDDGSCLDLQYIKEVYKNFKVIYVSAKENIGFDNLKDALIGKISAFSGNSGVGKSSITKNLLKDIDANIEIGDIATKTSRGKHTTKYVKLYEIMDDTFVLDTPGFSSYELYDINYKELKKYYKEFDDYSCDYDDCMHVLEDERVCKVKSAVINGNIDKDRYNRYVYIFSKLKEMYDKRYR